MATTASSGSRGAISLRGSSEATSAVAPHLAHYEFVARLYETPAYHDDPRFAPPTPLRERAFLTPSIAWGTAIEVLTLAAVMIITASNHFNVVDLGLALVGILLPIAWSGLAFKRMMASERENRPAQLAYEEALIAWNERLYDVDEDRMLSAQQAAQSDVAPADNQTRQPIMITVPVQRTVSTLAAPSSSAASFPERELAGAR